MIKDRVIVLSTVPITEGTKLPGYDSPHLPSIATITLKSDVLLDTSVISFVKDDAPTRRRLIRRINKLIEVKGNCWVAVDTLNELLRTPSDGRLGAVVSTLLHIDAEVRERLHVLDLVANAHRRELKERRRTMDTWPLDSLSSELLLVARTGSLDGAPVMQAALDQYNEFLRRHRPAMERMSAKWQENRAKDPKLLAEGRALLADFRAPHALIAARAMLWAVCKDYGWNPRRVEAEVAYAEAHYQDYLSCWTWAVLGTLRDVLETVPMLERKKLDPEIGALKTDRNDWMDANIVGAGARCGTLITHDGDLHQRCTMLYDRDLIGIASELFPDD